MGHLLVRYGEIGKKSYTVRNKMIAVLRQRVADRLRYEDIDFEKVAERPGRILVEEVDTEKAIGHVAEIPGVSSVSPAFRTESDMESLKQVSEQFEYGDTFGVVAKRTGDHEFSSQDIGREVGAHVEEFSGSSVDLDNPDTQLGIEVREEIAYVFTERVEGPDGLPVGTQEELAALISGGIDSPVAAYQVMKRGSSVLPIYFYNKPIAAEDHWLRFKSVIQKLKRFHPTKNWEVYRVDMEEVNEELMKVDRGRMILHRAVMFAIAEKIVEKEGLNGIVTGESLGQKSSQTATNLSMTSVEIDKTIFRPLLGMNKNQIIEVAEDLGTFDDAKIDSACTSISPDNPATSLQKEDFEELKEKVDFDSLVTAGFDSTKKIAV